MTWEIFGTAHLGIKMLNFENLHQGEEIRVKVDAVIDDKTHQFETDVLFFDWDKNTGKLLCLHGSQKWLISPENVVGKVIRYTETKVVSF